MNKFEKHHRKRHYKLFPKEHTNPHYLKQLDCRSRRNYKGLSPIQKYISDAYANSLLKRSSLFGLMGHLQEFPIEPVKFHWWERDPKQYVDMGYDAYPVSSENYIG